MRVKIGTGEGARNVDPSKFDDLAENVRERVHHERTLVPMAPTKMDVSGVDNGGHSSPAASAWDNASSCGGQPYIEPVALGGDQPASGYNDQWGGNADGWDLDAFSKGKGKGDGD